MPLFARLIGIVPCGIGLTLIIWLWSMPFGGFHSPPLFFRIMGSFVALFFILIGSGIIIGGGMANQQQLLSKLKEHQENLKKGLDDETQVNDDSPLNYSCSTCGAPLDDGADVSPHGDVKCGHCGKWYNVHQQSS